MSYLAITLFLAGFAWYWWDSKGFLQPPSIGPMLLMCAAAVAYIIVRAFLFQNRRVQRALQREQVLKGGPGRKL